MNDQLMMDDLRASRRVSDDQISALADRHALTALREGIIMTDRNDSQLVVTPRRGWRLGKRRLVAGGAAAVLALTGAATAYAVFVHKGETAGIGCHLEADTMTVISPVTGDPVADCIAAAAQAGQEVPEGLVAYKADGVIVVAPPSLAPPEGRPLPAGSLQDTAVIELAAALQDEVDSPAGEDRCGTGQAWATYARAEIDRIGLEGWTVEGDTASSDCAYAFPDASTRSVVIDAREDLGTSQGAGSSQAKAAHPNAQDLANLRDTLRTRISQGCVTLDQAEAIVRIAVRDNHFYADEGLNVSRVTDDDAQCSRIDLALGGALDVRLYGR
jgi:hypothetical protein